MVACPSRALVVLYRMLTIFACYVLTFMFGMLFLILTTSLECFVYGFCFSNNGLNVLPWTSFTCYTKDNQQGCFRLSNWFSLRRLGPWMNHLLEYFVHGFCFSNNGLNVLPWTSFTCYTKDNQQGCFRLSNCVSLRRLWPWMNHLPPAW